MALGVIRAVKRVGPEVKGIGFTSEDFHECQRREKESLTKNEPIRNPGESFEDVLALGRKAFDELYGEEFYESVVMRGGKSNK